MEKKLFRTPLLIVFLLSITQIVPNVTFAHDNGQVELPPSILSQFMEQQSDKNRLPVNELDQRVDVIKNIIEEKLFEETNDKVKYVFLNVMAKLSINGANKILLCSLLLNLSDSATIISIGLIEVP